jgi:hypothetical protein
MSSIRFLNTFILNLSNNINNNKYISIKDNINNNNNKIALIYKTQNSHQL